MATNPGRIAYPTEDLTWKRKTAERKECPKVFIRHAYLAYNLIYNSAYNLYMDINPYPFLNMLNFYLSKDHG